MTIIVPSYVRVGSTWVCRTASSLIEAKEEYIHIKGKIEDSYSFLPNTVYKTHDSSPREFFNLVKDKEDFLCIVVKRNFMDAFLSKLLYEKNNRGTERLPRSTVYHKLFLQYPNITDKAAINLIVEANREFVRQEIKLWYTLSETVVHDRYLIVDYDKCVYQGETYLTDLLASKIPSTSQNKQRAYEYSSFEVMKNSYEKDFVRKGRSGEWKNYYDKQSVSFIETEIEKVFNK